MIIRFIAFNISPFVKRIFFYDQTLYQVFSYIPILLLLNFKLRITYAAYAIVFSLLLLAYSSVRGHNELQLMYFLVVLVFSGVFYNISFSKQFKYGLPFFIIACLYGLSQKYFGYNSFELGWINSGLGAVSVDGYFVTDDIRPFSFFAGVPEFAFFVSIYLYYFWNKGSVLGQLVCLLVMALIGSRGVLVATSVAYAFLLFGCTKYFKRSALIFFSILGSHVFVYIMAFYYFPLFIQPFFEQSDARLLVYGTLNARVEILAEVFGALDLKSLFVGLPVYRPVVDNMFLFLIGNYGLLACLLYLYFLYGLIKDTKSFYFVSIIIGYSLYADVLLSLFLMFNFFVATFSKNGTSQGS